MGLFARYICLWGCLSTLALHAADGDSEADSSANLVFALMSPARITDSLNREYTSAKDGAETFPELIETRYWLGMEPGLFQPDAVHAVVTWLRSRYPDYGQRAVNMETTELVRKGNWFIRWTILQKVGKLKVAAPVRKDLYTALLAREDNKQTRLEAVTQINDLSVTEYMKVVRSIRGVGVSTEATVTQLERQRALDALQLLRTTARPDLVPFVMRNLQAMVRCPDSEVAVDAFRAYVQAISPQQRIGYLMGAVHQRNPEAVKIQAITQLEELAKGKPQALEVAQSLTQALAHSLTPLVKETVDWALERLRQCPGAVTQLGAPTEPPPVSPAG
ncbi:hypothetical protein K2X33_08730 [bacterium]|nr:hypothetical protein [bacterium]